MPSLDETLLKPEGRVLSTLEADGSRRWLCPKLSTGRFWQARRIVAYALIAIFTLIPYLTINGKPAVLLDIVARQFTLFGYTFLPTDTLLLALLMVSLLLGIFAFTAVLGRVWCGWACPQTVYMEYVYRPIERLFTGRSGQGGKPKHEIRGVRAAAMYALFFVISFYLAHTFLAYFVGVANLREWIFGSPFAHPIAFIVVVAVTGLMMFDFTFFREQLCIVACPYGRFQSVLLDRQSLIVSYDRTRGEPRGRKSTATKHVSLKLAEASAPVTSHQPLATATGDCIDCTMCVQVCPTGIDIRDGLQLECINCTQCIDACDSVMDKVGRPRGLIRYSSQAAMAGERTRFIRPRVVLYTLAILGLVSVLTTLVITKPSVDLTILRNAGRPFNLLEGAVVENALHLKITNRSSEARVYTVSIPDHPEIRIVSSNPNVALEPEQMVSEPLRLLIPRSSFRDGKLDIVMHLTGDDGRSVQRKYRLIGPLGAVEVSP